MLIEYIPLIILTALATALGFWWLSSDEYLARTVPLLKKANLTNQG